MKYYITILILLFATIASAQVSIDSGVCGPACPQASSSAATTLTTGSFTVSAGSNIAAGISEAHQITGEDVTAASVGAVNLAFVTGTRCITNHHAEIWTAGGIATGSQTASVTISGAAEQMEFGVIIVDNVDQVTPMNNGTIANGTTATPSVTITTTSGDMTLDAASAGAATVGSLGAPTQTQAWEANITSGQLGGGSIAASSGSSNVHQWSIGGTTPKSWCSSGANFKQSAAAASACGNLLLLGVGC